MSEAEAMVAIEKALEDLDPEVQRRILRWANERWNPEVATLSPQETVIRAAEKAGRTLSQPFRSASSAGVFGDGDPLHQPDIFTWNPETFEDVGQIAGVFGSGEPLAQNGLSAEEAFEQMTEAFQAEQKQLEEQAQLRLDDIFR